MGCNIFVGQNNCEILQFKLENRWYGEFIHEEMSMLFHSEKLFGTCGYTACVNPFDFFFDPQNALKQRNLI